MRQGPGTVMLALFLAIAGLVGAAPVPLARDAADSAARVQRAVAGGNVRISDLTTESNAGTIYSAPCDVPPGRYRLHAVLALHPLGELATAWLELTLKAGPTESAANALAFALPDEFTDLTLDFAVTEAPTPVGITWAFAGKAAGVARSKAVAKTATMAKSTLLAGDAAEAPDETAALNDLEGQEGYKPMASAQALAACLMLREVHLEPLSPVAVTAVRTDRITYRRGDPGKATAQLHNASATPQPVTLTVMVRSGLDRTTPVRTEQLTIPAQSALTWQGEFATAGLAWGNSLAVTATVAGQPPATGAAVFSVPDHFWDVAVMASCPAQMTRDFTTMARAREAAAQLKERGFNGFEAYFWAPCDFLDYTPDTEVFYSGQTAYCQSTTGTRNLLAACHELGIIGTFYANLWGGSSTPAFAVMRRHPEWFGNANFHSGALDDAALMDAGVIRGPGHKVWSYNQLNDRAPLSLFDYHVQEILGARRMFAWDGIRYDSYYSAPWTIAAMTHIRERLRKEAPEFLFGYNAFAPAEYAVGAMDALAGGLIMGEGLRVGAGSRVEDYVRGLSQWRDLAWPYGTAIGPLYGFTSGTDNKDSLPPSPLDHVLMSSAVMAAGAHPYYNRMQGDYPAFAVRYAEYLFNTKMRVPRAPEQVVKFPPGVEPLAWRELLRCVALSDGRQRLVLHLLNVAPAAVLGTLDMKCLPPLHRLPVSFALPDAAAVTGAWLLQAVPAATHQALPVTMNGPVASVTLPEVRFYGVVVLEFTAPTPFPEQLDARTRRQYQAHPVADWWVIGPFPSDANLGGYATVYPPERGVDLKAVHPGAGSKEVAWTHRPPPAVARPISVDFLEQWPDWREPGVAYAWTRVVADRARDAWLFTGSDDTITVWWNGEQVLALKTERGTAPDAEQTKVHLKAGENTVLVKVCQKAGGWSFFLRLGEEDGRPLPEGQ